MSAKKKESAVAQGLYLVCGEDDYLVSSKAREIVDSIIPKEEQLTALEIIDGVANNAAEVEASVGKCISALSSGGLFSARKLVWLRDVNYAGSGRTAQSDAARTAVASLLDFLKQGLSPDSYLLVTADKVDKRSAFYKCFAANGEVHVFGGGKQYEVEKDAVSFLSGKLSELGLKMNNTVSSAFLEKVGTSTRLLVSELEKLSIYAGSRKEITLDDVSEVTSSSRTAVAWDLADAFGEKDLVKAIIILRRLLYQNENEVGIIIALQGRIRDLIIYRDAMDMGWIRKGGRGWYEWGAVSEEAERAFSSGGLKDPRTTHPFRVNIIAGQAAKFSLQDLKAMLALSVKAHERLVSTSDSKQNILETLLVRILRDRRKSAA